MQPINYANLFSGNYDDRIDDVYFELIDRLDKSTLESYCKTSKELTNFCNSDYWLGRITQAGLTPLLPFRSFYSSLASFYKFIRQDACYIVARGTFVSIPEQKQKAFTNIQLAYNSILRSIALDVGKDVNTLTDADIIHTSKVEEHKIVVMFNGVKLRELEQDNYAIWTNLEGAKNYNNPNILSFPILESRDIVVIRYFGENVPECDYLCVAGMILMLPFDGDFAKFPPYATMSSPINYRIRLLPVNYDGKYLYLDYLTTKDNGPIYCHLENRWGIIVLNTAEVLNKVNYKIVVLIPNTVVDNIIIDAIKANPISKVIDLFNSLNAVFFDLSQLRTVIIKYLR